MSPNQLSNHHIANQYVCDHASTSAAHVDIRTEGQEHTETLLCQTAPRAATTPRVNGFSPLNACSKALLDAAQFKPGIGATLSGLGMMVDMYDLCAMNIAMGLMENTYGPRTPAQDALLSSSVLVGSVVGQLGFGATADRIGRRNLTLLVSALTLVGSLGTALARPSNAAHPTSIYGTISAMRFVLGLGIGGEYPLSASNTVEQTPIKHSSTAIAYAMMILNSGCVVAAGAFGGILLLNPDNDDTNWRLGLGFGAVLSAATLGLRTFLLKESPAFTEAEQPLLMQDIEAAPPPEPLLPAQLGPGELGPGELEMSQNQRSSHPTKAWLKPLAGAACTWFLYDVASFGIGLYSSDMLSGKGDVFSATKSLLVSNAIALPFSALSMLTISDHLLGRKNSQILGLSGMALALACMALSEHWLWHTTEVDGEPSTMAFNSGFDKMLFTAIFAAYNSFDALGPGTSTFAFSSEIFPTHRRGTFHGLAAAAGKAGGVIGTAAFPYLKQALGAKGSLGIMAGACALGAVFTQWLLPNYTNNHLHQLEANKGETDENLVQMLYKDSPT